MVGSFYLLLFIVVWFSGEFGVMGLEGVVWLGFVKELVVEEDF